VYDAPLDVKLRADEDDESPTVVQPDIAVTGEAVSDLSVSPAEVFDEDL
jgi:hypothetical protein